MSSVRTVAGDPWRAAVVLRGDIDLATVPRLRAELQHHIDAGRRVIRIDARDVRFMDATAIGELVTATQRCRATHASLILVGVPDRVRRLLSVAGVDQVLLIDDAGRLAGTADAAAE